jgi:hypothetical protein
LKNYEVKNNKYFILEGPISKKRYRGGPHHKIDFEEKYKQSKSQNLKMKERRKKDGGLYFLVAISLMAKVEEIKL